MDLITSSQQLQCTQTLKPHNSLLDVIAFAFYWLWTTVMPTRWSHHSLGRRLRLNSPMSKQESLYTLSISPSSMEKASCLQGVSICDLQSAFHLIVHSLHMREPTKIRIKFWWKNKTDSFLSENTKSLQLHSKKLRLSKWMGGQQTCTSTWKAWIKACVVKKDSYWIQKDISL